MKSLRSLLVLLVVSAFMTPFTSAQEDWTPWVVTEGRVVMRFHDSLLDQLGLEVVGLEETADVLVPSELEKMSGDLVAFAIKEGSDLRVLRGDDGGFVPYGVLGGAVEVEGGFALASKSTGKVADFHGFRIHPQPVVNDGPGGIDDPDYFFMTTGGNLAGRDFLMCYVKVYTGPSNGVYPSSGGDHEKDIVQVKAWDLIVSDELARELGRPDLAGEFLALGKLEADIAPYTGSWALPRGQNPYTPTGGTPDPTTAGDGGVVDVKIGFLDSMSWVGHTGAFGSGRTGMSMATTSCNVGTAQVPWLAPDTILQEDHPGIAMQLHRELNGRFEQVGQGWIKHGFFALSNSQCDPCQGGSAFGTFLGVGCSDTYGTGNNSDQFWLGDRDEWDPHAGTWECEGSFFDGTPVDCVRNENGSGLGPVNHRLEAWDEDLANAGATYWYEAFYMVRADSDKSNNIGSRRTTITNSGSQFNFSTPTAGSGNPMVNQPAIMNWGEMQSEVDLNPDDGSVILAVETTDLGGGQWRYEYALYNWTLDRKIRSFSVPTCGSAFDFYFHDIDKLPTNEWVLSTVGGNARWEFNDVVADPGPSMQAGALAYGTVVNFGFTSFVAPGDRDAVLGVHEAGAGGDLMLAATKAPAGCVNLTADTVAPLPGSTMTLTAQGGTDHALFAVITAGGIPIPAVVFPGAPVPFVSGEVNLPIPVPAFVTGIEVEIVVADVQASPLSMIQLGNVLPVAIQ